MNVQVLDHGAGTLVIRGEDGQQSTFRARGDGTHMGAPGVRSKLAVVAGGGWVLTRVDQSRLTFDASGKLLNIVDRNGLGLTLTYTGGRLVGVADHAGRTVSFSYNTAGLLAQMTFPPSRSVSYTYDSSGRLASVTDATSAVTAYSYDSNGRLASITDPNGHGTSPIPTIRTAGFSSRSTLAVLYLTSDGIRPARPRPSPTPAGTLGAIPTATLCCSAGVTRWETPRPTRMTQTQCCRRDQPDRRHDLLHVR